MRFCIVGIIFSNFVATCYAADVTVYRWVDENNVVHFSQHQPTHENYTELTMTEAYKPTEEVNQSSDQANSSFSSSLDEVDPIAQKKCNDAKANVRTLTDFENIQYTETNGETRTLSAKEKQQQLEISKKEVEVYCGAQ